MQKVSVPVLNFKNSKLVCCPQEVKYGSKIDFLIINMSTREVIIIHSGKRPSTFLRHLSTTLRLSRRPRKRVLFSHDTMVARNNKIIRSITSISLRRASPRRAHSPAVLDEPSRARASIEPSHSSAAAAEATGRSSGSLSRDASFDADDLDALDAMLSLNRTLSFEDSDDDDDDDDDDERRTTRRSSSTTTTALTGTRTAEATASHRRRRPARGGRTE